MSSPAPADAPKAFDAKPTLKYASVTGAYGAGVGLFASTIQNALSTHSSGAMGVFTRFGSTIGFTAAMGFTFAATEALVANTREVDDALNGAAGACAAGFLIGLRKKSLPLAFGGCAVLGATMGAFDYAGGLGGSGPRLTAEERRAKFFKSPPPTIAQPEPSSA